nr:proline-rich protein HaeIII subfamily 1 isoform X1 [Megalopta genalis]
MKHLVVAAAAAILVLAVTGVSSKALAKAEPPKEEPPRDEPPRDEPMEHREKRSPQGDPRDMTTMGPRGKRSPHGGPGDMTTTMGPREKRSPHGEPRDMTTMPPRAKRSPQTSSADCPPPPDGPPPSGPPPNGPPPCGPPPDMSTQRKKRFAQNPASGGDIVGGSPDDEDIPPVASVPGWMLHNGNMGKVSNMIISTT